jgi:outer membrane protein OmpA-like peptidoglycan-associated protein
MTSMIIAAVFASKAAVALKLPTSVKDAGNQAKTAAADKANDEALNAITKKLKNVQNEYGPILFKAGKAAVDPKCDKTMQRITDILAEYPGFHVQVDGHTDNVGRKAKNQKLSEDRAAAVVAYLVKVKNVDAKRLSAKGFGDTQPIADNKTKEGQAKNRRVDFTATKL